MLSKHEKIIEMHAVCIYKSNGSRPLISLSFEDMCASISLGIYISSLVLCKDLAGLQSTSKCCFLCRAACHQYGGILWAHNRLLCAQHKEVHLLCTNKSRICVPCKVTKYQSIPVLRHSFILGYLFPSLPRMREPSRYGCLLLSPFRPQSSTKQFKLVS